MLIKEKDFEGFADGCEKAFEVIFRQYYKTLVSFSMRYGLEQMEAEDVVIEVIHRIWEIRKEVKSPAALNALFYTSVRNRTVNVVRNLKKPETDYRETGKAGRIGVQGLFDGGRGKSCVE